MRCPKWSWTCWADVTPLTCADITCPDGSQGSGSECGVDDHCTQNDCCDLNQAGLSERCYNRWQVDHNGGRVPCEPGMTCELVSERNGKCKVSGCPTVYKSHQTPWFCSEQNGLSCEHYQCERGYTIPNAFMTFCDGDCTEEQCCIIEKEEPRLAKNDICWDLWGGYYGLCEEGLECLSKNHRLGRCKDPTYDCEANGYDCFPIYLETPLNKLLDAYE